MEFTLLSDFACDGSQMKEHLDVVKSLTLSLRIKLISFDKQAMCI